MICRYEKACEVTTGGCSKLRCAYFVAQMSDEAKSRAKGNGDRLTPEHGQAAAIDYLDEIEARR